MAAWPRLLSNHSPGDRFCSLVDKERPAMNGPLSVEQQRSKEPVARPMLDPVELYDSHYAVSSRRSRQWRAIGARFKAAHISRMVPHPPGPIIEIGRGWGDVCNELHLRHGYPKIDLAEISAQALKIAEEAPGVANVMSWSTSRTCAAEISLGGLIELMADDDDLSSLLNRFRLVASKFRFLASGYPEAALRNN